MALKRNLIKNNRSQQFGGSEYAIASSLGCSMEEAQKFKKAYDEGFKGITEFKKKGSVFVRQNGYILICKYTGHKIYWWDWRQWKERQETFNHDFWERYRELKKNDPSCAVVQEVRQHFKAASKYDRLALNSPTQGTGCIILKDAAIDMFNWVVDNGWFGKIKLCNLVHDEQLWEFPDRLKDSFPKLLEQVMLSSAAKYCKSLPIPAEAEVSDHWVH